MDCRTARHLLDCLHDGCPVSANPTASTDELLDQETLHADLMDHLEHCEHCQQILEDWRHFDRRIYSMLMSSPVPPGLETRLLAAVSPEAVSTIATAPGSPSAPLRWTAFQSRWTLLSLASVLVLALGGWWLWPVSEEPLNYNGAGQLLTARFLKSNAGWKDLENFDGSFDLGNFQSDLSDFQLSPAHGIDLGGGRGQDAAVFQFGLKNWGGILTVLPSQHFTGLPGKATSNVQSGRTVLQWRSSDGKLTYILFVHKGSAAELAQELFGLLT